MKNLLTSYLRSIKKNWLHAQCAHFQYINKKERTEDINVKEKENGETGSPFSAAKNDSENVIQDGFPSAGTCDRKDDRDVANSIHLYEFTQWASSYSS